MVERVQEAIGYEPGLLSMRNLAEELEKPPHLP
jgi:hypothetical protein